ncbi:MAG: ThiF family adenylyltransferase, partial [Armatimonadota bacterium]|nr:ThiF family adenylyltransferase [Armatimonadota bacterium]
MPTIHIPTALRPYTNNQASLSVEASTVGEAIRKLTEAFPKLHPHLFKEDGQLRSFVNLYLGDTDVRHLQGLDTPLAPDSELTIVPSVAGGVATVAESPIRSIIEDERLQAVSLSQEEVLRYSRHLIMPEVTMEGQRRLKAARVLLIGTGGLGSPLALYLAAAGVGTIGLVDFDVVDYTNLQRQIIHFTSDVGRPKLQSAIEKIHAINPHVNVIPFETRLTSENALEIMRDFDVIVDGTDNFPTRYLVNDACVLLGKPNVYGSIFRFEGQASVFWAQHGPCYRCLYPEPPPPGLVPSCAEGGVLGILPGLIGLVQ